MTETMKTHIKPSTLYSGQEVQIQTTNGVIHNLIDLGGRKLDFEKSELDRMKIQEAPKKLIMCYDLARYFSKDPSTQLGAIICDQYDTFNVTPLSESFNGFPETIKQTELRLSNRFARLKYTQHAERGAICRCCLDGISTRNTIMYCPWFSCYECAKDIITSGITTLIGHYEMCKASADMNTDWNEKISIAYEMFREANIAIYLWKGTLTGSDGDHTNDISVRLHKQIFHP